MATMRRPRLQSTLARAVVPVAAGIGFFALLGLALWGVAALISGDDQSTDLLTTRTFRPGHAENFAAIVADGGPILFADPIGTSGDRTIVLDHPPGLAPRDGWKLYLAYPADRPVSCKIEQIRGTRTFTDCEDRTIRVEELALPPKGVYPTVAGDGILDLDLIPDPPTTTVAPVGTGGG